ncbi:retrovirus-related pol polyprotein from transposon TNT 1-94 [Tanacetum coccineum]
MKTLNVKNVAKKCHFARDCFSKTYEPSYKSIVSNSSSVSKCFQPKFTPKLIQSSQHTQSSQNKPKFQKDYNAEYKKVNAKLALLEASPSTSRSPKPFQTKNKGLGVETFNWDEKEIYDNEEMIHVKVLIALADDELSVGKNHARNELQTPLPLQKNLQGASPSSEVMTLTYEDHSPKERPGLGTMKHTNPKTQESSNKNVSGTITVCDIEVVTYSVPTELKINDQESKIDEMTKLVQMLMGEKSNSTQMIQESKYVNQQPGLSKFITSSKLSQDSKRNGKNTNSSKPVRPKPLQKPKLKCKLCHYTNHLTDDCYRILYCMKCKKEDHRTSNLDMYVASLKSSKNYKAQSYQYASPSKQILKDKAKPFPPCTYCGFNDHHLDDFKQIRTDIGTKLRNYELESFCDEKGVSQNFSSPYTLEQNSIAERKNKTLIEAARIMMNSSVLSKYFWTEAVRIACYTQNKSIIVKRHDKTPYPRFVSCALEVLLGSESAQDQKFRSLPNAMS